MGKKREKKVEEGAPAWMVTFGDMMSLLLCFFVIIVSMSEIKKDKKFMKVAESIKAAFGYPSGIGYITGDLSPTNTFEKPFPQLLMEKFQLNEGKSSEEGIEGENPSVRMIREGLEYVVGGKLHFEAGKAVLLDEAKANLDEFVGIIKGSNTKIRVRGHVSPKPPQQYYPFKSLDELSYARAVAVKKHLMEKGIRESRINIEACSDHEPLRTQAYSEDSRAQNRRVTIIITEMLTEDFQGKPYSRSGEMIDG